MVARSINYAYGGGIARHTYELVNSLKKQGCEVTVACMDRPANNAIDIGNKILVSYTPLYFLDLISFNSNMLRKKLYNDVDIIHSQASDAFIFSVVKKVPFVVTAHNSGIKELQWVPKLRYHLTPYVTCMLEKYMYRRADGIIAVFKYTAESIHEDYGVSKKKIFLLPNGVDTQEFRPGLNAKFIKEKYDINGPLLLCVTRLAIGKFVEGLITIAKAVSKEIPDVKIMIVGGGPLKRYLENLRDKHGLRDKMIFVGKIKDELPYFYNAADLCFIPMARERGFTLFEACSCGKPVVYINITEKHNELAYDKTHSYKSPIIAVNSVKDFVSSVIYLLRNDDERKELGKLARKMAIEHLSWEKIAERTINIYEFLLSRS